MKARGLRGGTLALHARGIAHSRPWLAAPGRFCY
jgi:hypothetical protein